MSTPAAISWSSISGELVAGPIVAMIFVCLTGTAYSGHVTIVHPMADITPEPVLDDLVSLRSDPHQRLAVIDREGRAEGLPLVHPDTGALLHTLALSIRHSCRWATACQCR